MDNDFKEILKQAEKVAKIGSEQIPNTKKIEETMKEFENGIQFIIQSIEALSVEQFKMSTRIDAQGLLIKAFIDILTEKKILTEEEFKVIYKEKVKKPLEQYQEAIKEAFKKQEQESKSETNNVVPFKK